MSKSISIVPIGDLIQSRNDKSKQLQSGEYLQSGVLPIVDQGKKLVCGYTNDLSKSYDKGLPVVIFGDHTLHTKFIDFDFAIGADGTQVLGSKSDECDTKYLYYLVSRAAELIGSEGYKRHFRILREFDIEYIESLPEQQKIATILSSVDNVIEKTRAQIDKLKDLKTGMMQELLTKGIGHTEFKDSPVGRIPVSWSVIRLGQTGIWKGGGTPSKSNKEFWEGDIPWVSPKDMKSDFISKTEDYITSAAISGSSTNLVSAGSILIVARSGILKHTLPVAIASLDLTINQDIKSLTVNEQCSALYIFHYLVAQNYKILRATLKAGNTVESLDFAEFTDYLIPFPPLEEQSEIADVVESVAFKIRAKNKVLKSNKLLKEALMQDLLTGKVRVKPDELAAI